MFLVKIGDAKAKSLKVKIWFEYHAPKVPYHLENGKYLELKYQLHSSELRKEFYLDLLHDLCRLGDNFLGIYTRLMCFMAVKVSLILCVINIEFSSFQCCFSLSSN